MTRDNDGHDDIDDGEDSLNSKPDQPTACNQLQAFVNEVNAYVQSGKLTQAQADSLLGGPLGILAIMAAIPCDA